VSLGDKLFISSPNFPPDKQLALLPVSDGFLTCSLTVAGRVHPG
jgi:hypothetical protein